MPRAPRLAPRIALAASLALAAPLALAACGGGSAPAAPATTSAAPSAPRTVFDFEAKDIDGKPTKLAAFKGKVLLVVNVASQCGFTGQYEGLEALYEKHKAGGLEVLAFPSNQFGQQEPGAEAEIKTFCTTKYAVKFPLFSKIDVNGPDAHPLYVHLRAAQPGSFSKDAPGAEKLAAHLEKTQPEVLGTDAVKWNFTKFLVARDGSVVKRFESYETPEAIEPAIAAELGKR